MSTTITGLPNASTPLDGTERVPMDQAGVTVDATTQAIADLAPGTDLSYNASTRQLSSSTGQDVTLPLAGAEAGLMAAADKGKLDGIQNGAEANVNADWNATSGDAAILNKPTLGTAAAAATTDFATAAQGAKADTAVQPAGLAAYVQTSDARLSDAREWSAETIGQAEAEAGTATTRRAFTAQRVFQAIAAWWAASSAKTKLDGIESGAQANAPTDLSYDAASREVRSSTGADVVLPVVTTSAAGLMRPVDLGDVIILACSDETTDLATGTARVTFRMPWAATLTSVRLNVNTAPTGSALIADVNEGGVSVFSTRPQIDAGARTSVGSTVTPVISDSALAADAEITVDIDQVGSTIKGKGLKIALYVTRV